jgi:protein tyrosine/serine phosphatase
VTQRALPFADIYNFRDLGGYPTATGRTTAWRRIYRSDDLCRLTDGDKPRFADLGIRTVIDLRRPDEVLRRGRVPEFTGVDYHNLHLVHTDWDLRSFTDVDERTAFLLERYLDMAVTGADAIGRALRLIADAQAGPLVVHCIAGKDRTGMVCALTLSLLGVTDEIVADDYALSEEPAQAYHIRNGADPYPTLIAPAATMLGFLTGLRAAHGSIEAYVRSLGVTEDDIAAMRAHLLT